jgi:hypothetical protein
MVGGTEVYHPVNHRHGGSGQPARDCGSHSLNHGIEGDDCSDRGGGNEGTTYCIKKPYWGTVKKVCAIDQYGAPPMHGLNEDGQAGCTEKPYWGAANEVCGIDQYGLCPWMGRRTTRWGCQRWCLQGLQRQLWWPRG